MNTPDSVVTRAHAARALNAVIYQNRTIDWVMLNKPQWLSTALAKELVYGATRHYFSLFSQLQSQLKKPLRDKDQILNCLLLVGAYQLEYTSVPAHAAINETVSACSKLSRPWARGLVNAILRKFTGADLPRETPEQTFDHPQWMIERIQADHTQDWQSILPANNARAPMTLRINQQRTTPEAYQQLLQKAGIEYQEGYLPESIVLQQPVSTSALPKWQKGYCAVQDQGAQLVSSLMIQLTGHYLENHPDPPVRILDACAAPGGKLHHLHESVNAAHAIIDAIELNPQRLEQTRSLSARLGHKLNILEADATDDSWFSEPAYQAILLDAPCSGSGTLRRHPEIKILARSADIPGHAQQQLQMLNNLWRVLATGGTLLYCTCSIFEEENDQVIRQFLHQKWLNPAPDVLPVALPSGQSTGYGWQLLPTDQWTDGFYVCALHKLPEAASKGLSEVHNKIPRLHNFWTDLHKSTEEDSKQP